MAFDWSPAQKAAFEAKGVDTLVSAGAGSGKTAVLTERVHHLIKNGASIERFLVLTFTNAAAAEMKIRVRKKLLDDPKLKHLAVAIENSHIETFDSFNLFLVKKYSFELGVTQNISIIDNNFILIKARKILDDIFEEEFVKGNPDFLNVVYKYCLKDDSVIKNLIINIINLSDKQIKRDEYLNDFINYYFNENRLKSFIDEYLDFKREDINKIINMSMQLQDSKDANQIIECMQDLLAAKDYDEFYNLCLKSTFPRKPLRSGATDDKYRNQIKEVFKQVVSTKFGTSREIIDSYLGDKDVVAYLVDISKKVIKKLDEYKNSVGSYSFSDVQRMAIQILEIPAIRKEMQNYFDFIMVDEYQDTSDSQEKILTAISRNNLYMVGDVKQSIYAFRNANCGIFLDKYNNFKKGIGGQEIDLNTSYRSRRQVVDFVNDTFSKLMVPENNIIDYSNGHNFGFGFTNYDDMEDNRIDYNVKSFNYTYEKAEEVPEKEAEIIAQDIINKYNEKINVLDKDKGFSSVSYKHFAILLGTKTAFETYRKVFTEKGIPIRVIASEPVTSSAVSQVTKSLLVLFESISNGRFDDPFKHAYISIARSFLCCVDDQVIHNTVISNDYSKDEIFNKVLRVCKHYKYSSIYEILNALYNEFDLYNEVIRLGNVASNIHKVELFLNCAENLDSLSCTVKDFIDYFDQLNDLNADFDFSDKDISEDAVTLINYHKSKGLEYPFCYFADLNRGWNRGDKEVTSFLVNEKYGVVLPLTGETNQYKLFNSLFKMENTRKDREERIRLFYVAITRARESITFLVGHKGEGKRPAAYNDCNCYGDFIKLLDLDSQTAVPLPSKCEYESDTLIKALAVQTLGFREISIASKPVGLKNRASKELIEDVDDSLLEFGTRLHYLLEVANYETKDTSYIKENNLRKYVSNVLNCGLFNNVKNEQVLHEYSFFDETNNTNGVIDCMIIKDDEIDIIDFKLKKINDAKYNRQLNVYGKYIESITNKSVKLYLLSSITGEVKEIERD